MPDFWALRRIRNYRSRKKYEPYTLINNLVDGNGGGEAKQQGTRSSLEISVLSFRAQSDGKTGFAAFKAMCREHPVLVHGLYTYLSVSSLLLVLIVATTLQGR
ncbi:hypothetical protein [Streptomyces sp. 35G-GA-8]|uniref:hypothetical protein n=1 Tax=Streptomyces sp. 35G-GA-8 TaxID=2939434 RepID=UPI00201EA2BB|nr:hypothetical protein [Streptomyces sp. 35G-GA-8]MCL7376994.1 hypothetical protein [Streptomyces sp. 35G-GA-8]